MKVTPKFTLALAAGVLCVQVAFGALRVEREQVLFQTDVARDEGVVGRAVALAAERELRTAGVAGARNLVQEANRGDAHVQIRWVDVDASPGAPYAPRVQRDELGPLLRGEPVWAQTSDEHAAAFNYTPVMHGDRVVGAIEVSDSLKDEREYMAQSVRNAVLSTVALVALCGLIAWGLGHVLIGRPVQLLVRRARAIGEGDLETTIDLAQRDELGQLAGEMNAMAKALARTRERLDDEARARIAVVEQLKHADRLRTVGTLASGIAHELGTPLNVVEGYAQLIMEDLAAGGEAHENARVIKRQSKRMANIIRQLLDFARREQDGDGTTNVHAALVQTIDMIAPFGRKRGVTVIGHCPDDRAEVPLRTDELVQVLSNIVINGIQAMDDGGEVRIDVTAERRARPWADEPARDMIRIEVTDEGTGMDEETVQRVFEPFFTTKQVGEGTGLGLSVVYGIVSERKGWIDVQSRPDAGSTFSIFLPMAQTT